MTVASPSTHLGGGPILVSSSSLPPSSTPHSNEEEDGGRDWKPVERDLNEEEKKGLYILAGIFVGGFVMGGLGKKRGRKVAV